MLRSFIREVLHESKGKKATVHAMYSVDMGLILKWARLNDAISSSSAPKKTETGYSSSVTLKTSKSELEDLLKARFGTFVKVS